MTGGTVPAWLDALSILSLAVGVGCATLLAVDVVRRPQTMWIMDIVWPVCALFGGPLLLWLYARHGRAAAPGPAQPRSGGQETPFPFVVANGTLHCGSGCTLGDIVAEWLVVAAPVVAIWFGWHTLFGARIVAVWVVDYLFAYAFGIVFQYFSIAPMRNLSLGRGLTASIKADTLSLTAWQLGMYGFMALANFVIFRHWIGARLRADTPVFWFMMQIAMLCGFATAYPVNWWLLRTGIKSPM